MNLSSTGIYHSHSVAYSEGGIVTDVLLLLFRWAATMVDGLADEWQNAAVRVRVVRRLLPAVGILLSDSIFPETVSSDATEACVTLNYHNCLYL